MANVRTGGGVPCRSAVRHGSRPCNAVQADSLSPVDRPQQPGVISRSYEPYSHSMVAGGLPEMSYTTRLTPGTVGVARLRVGPTLLNWNNPGIQRSRMKSITTSFDARTIACQRDAAFPYDFNLFSPGVTGEYGFAGYYQVTISENEPRRWVCSHGMGTRYFSRSLYRVAAV